MKCFAVAFSAALLMPLAVGPAAAQVVPPPMLKLLDGHRVYIQYAGPGQPNTVEFDPFFKEATVGNSYASADLAAGLYKGSAYWPDTVSGVTVQIAYSGADFKVRNDSAIPVTSVFSLDLDAALAQIYGPANGGVFQNLVVAVISGSGPSFTASAGVAYQYVGRGGATDLLSARPQSTTPGSSTVIHSATTSELDATLALADFTLAPGETASLSVTLQTGASGSQLGWGAFTDASHSAQLSLLLPAGVSIESPVPLPWVTSIPEPSTVLLMLVGLAGVAVRQHRHSRDA